MINGVVNDRDIMEADLDCCEAAFQVHTDVYHGGKRRSRSTWLYEGADILVHYVKDSSTTAAKVLKDSGIEKTIELATVAKWPEWSKLKVKFKDGEKATLNCNLTKHRIDHKLRG